MRKRRLYWNTIAALSRQIIVIICGFILSRLILVAFGSEVNGLAASITQFLAMISFLELGIGAVIESSLYEPLATKNKNVISAVMASSSRFFQKIAIILLFYIAVLVVFYVLFMPTFGYVYTITLIIVMSIHSFAQYYFGISNQILLSADQKGYIIYIIQGSTVLINTVLCAVLINIGYSIHIIKLTTSMIYLVRPLVYHLYVKKHYSIDWKFKYDGEPIKQKWNGLAQHIAAVLLDNTDVVILTFFSTLSNVSVYEIYHLVVYSVKQIFLSTVSGLQALLGELWAKQEFETLTKTLTWVEWLIHTGTVFIFGCTGVLIVPFVRIYTRGVTDTNYIVPVFAILITIANALHCLRLPYNIMVKACGRYKETQQSYVVSVILNIIISILLAKNFGLVGVATGTIIAMLYQTVWLALYMPKILRKWSIKNSTKQVFIDLLIVTVSAYLTYWLKTSEVNYFSWIILAIKVYIIWSIVIIIINVIFCKDKMQYILNAITMKVKKKNDI